MTKEIVVITRDHTTYVGESTECGNAINHRTNTKKRSKNMKCKLFTHTDLDGVGCTILAYLAFGRENVDVEYCNYNDVNEKVRDHICYLGWQDYDQTYITDISLTEDLAIIINETNEDYKVHLFDHHKTAEYLNQFDWCQVLEYMPFTNSVKTSGTQMFYTYLRSQCTCLDEFSSRIQRNISKFVDVVRNYDTWRWKELGVEGIVCKQVNDLFYIYGRDTFISWVNMQMNTSKVFPDFLYTDKSLLDFRKNDIDRYVEEKDKSLIQVEDKDHRWFGLVFADRYISELGNRLCEMNPGLEYVAIVNISTGQVSYRTISDDINLGTEIAHAYGGGGHPKAAGSTFDINTAIQKISEIIFHKDNDTYKGNE